MVQAISACPGIIDDLMTIGEKVKKAEIGVDEFVDGLIDMEAEKELAKVEAALELEASDSQEEEADDENDTGKASGMSPEDLAELTAEVLRRFGVIKRAHKKLGDLRAKQKWMDDPEYQKHQDNILKELVNFRFASKFVELLCDKIRTFIIQIRTHERQIMEFCIENSKMPRAHFVKNFPGNETDLKWLKEQMKVDKPYVVELEKESMTL